MDQFNFNNFPETNFNEVNLSWMLEVMTQFKEDIESGQFVGPQGPQGEPGPAGDGITEEVKQALLQLARKVAYIDDQGQTYYQDLYDALYGTTPTELVSISAVYTQAGAVYDTDSLDSLKSNLVVTATYSDNSTAVIPAADYTLSGSLTVGTSTITVTYNGKTATFQVIVTASSVTLVSISAAFNQGSAVIYDTDSLDTLRQYLTVTATYSDSSTATVTDYTLSGTLTEGTSTITVAYGGKISTFDVTVSVYSREAIFGTFVNGHAVSKGTLSGSAPNNSVWVSSTSARAAFSTPIANNGYVLTVTDSSKYNLAVYDVADNTPVSTTQTQAVDGVYYAGGTKSISWKTSDSATTPYILVSLKKMDNTAFTAEELSNGAEAVFTFTTT